MTPRCSVAAALLTVAIAAGCATPAPEGQLIADPYENVNRRIHAFNVGLDRFALRPAAIAYDSVTPALGQHLIGNAIDHLRLPVVLINNVLQADFAAAADTLGRFVANTALGAGGLLDPATELGLPFRETDFGVTLARWGAAEGPYVVLPVFGPSTGRDVPGRVGDFALDPVTYVGLPGGTPVTVARIALPPIDARSQAFEPIDQILYESEDSYVTLRSVFVQNRRRVVAGGQTPDAGLPDVLGPDAASPAAQPAGAQPAE
jgi:phospholipid-binding lipoprotein MlaA